MTYFITIEELKQTTFNANLDDEYIAPALEEAQSIYLREIIGDLLYNSITSKIDSETLNGKYLTLVNQYIKPYLTYKVQSVIVIPLNNKTRNAGVIQQYDQGFNTSTMKDTAYLADYYNSRAEFYANRLTTYLQKNAADFPEYGYSDDNITQPTTSQNVTGIFLGGVGKKGCGCIGTGTSTTKTVDWNNITNKPDFADVATSGDYEDLENRPDIPSLEGYATEQWVNDQGYSTFDGDYNSLTNKPTIPAAQVNSDWYAESGVSQILHKPTLSTVATTGDYYDLDNIPTIPPAPAQADWYESDPHELSYINNKPNLAEVATSGDYNDLTNKPTIPAAQVNSDWYADSGVSQILNKPDLNDYVRVVDYNVDKQYIDNTLNDKVDVGTFNNRMSAVWTSLAGKVETGNLCRINNERLDTNSNFELVRTDSIATVATTGDYNDLNNTPTIPTVNNATLTIKQGGVARGTFSANAGTDVEINLDAGGAAQVQADWNEADSTAVDYIKNKPTIPTVPTNVSAFTNDAGYLTQHQDLTGYATENYVDSAIQQVEQEIPTVPTNVSAFTNDAGYLTQHQSLDGYATEEWVSEQGFSTFSGSYNDLTDKPTIPTVNDALLTIKQGGVTKGTFSANSNQNIEIDLDAGGAAQEQADWNQSDNTAVDYIKNKPTIPTVPTNVSAFTNDAGYLTQHQSLAGYATENYVDSAIQQVEQEIPTVPTNVSAFTNDAGYLTQHQSLAGYATETWVQQQDYSTFDGDYNSLTNKPTIPAAQVNSDWNAVSGVAQILNKPTIPTKTSELTNDSGFTTFDGDYNSLTNKPTIPAAQVQTDWNANSGMGQLLNKPSMTAETWTFTLSDNTTVTKTVWLQ